MRRCHRSFITGLIALVALIPVQSMASGAPDDVMKALADGNTTFALDLYGKLRVIDGNLFLSPYSVSTALAMTHAGARGETASQMADVLALRLPQDEINQAWPTSGDS